MFMDQSYHSNFKAPEERNISHASHIAQNISLLWSWRQISDPTIYKHSIPTGLGYSAFFIIPGELQLIT